MEDVHLYCVVLYLLATNNLFSSEPEERLPGVFPEDFPGVCLTVLCLLSVKFSIQNKLLHFPEQNIKRGSNRSGVKKWEQTFENVSGYDCNPCSPRKGTRHCVGNDTLGDPPQRSASEAWMKLFQSWLVLRHDVTCDGILERYKGTPAHNRVSFCDEASRSQAWRGVAKRRSVSFPFSGNKGYSRNPRRSPSRELALRR